LLGKQLFYIAPFFCDGEDINDFQNAGGVDDKKSQEPPFLVILCGYPQRTTFPKQRPQYYQNYDPTAHS